jgi:hypothetical protein
MRTTIRINDKILISAKKKAASENISLTKLIEEALLDKLYSPERPRGKHTVDLVTVNGNGLRPGVDLDDSAALLEVLEE